MSGPAPAGGAGSEPVWLSATQVRMLHAESIALFGGSDGLRDENLLGSALGRPKNRWAYGDGPSPFELAVAYAFGLTRERPFVDGNKRVGTLAIRAFLFRNGHRFSPDQVELVTVMEGVAAGTVDEGTLATWIEENLTPR